MGSFIIKKYILNKKANISLRGGGKINHKKLH